MLIHKEAVGFYLFFSSSEYNTLLNMRATPSSCFCVSAKDHRTRRRFVSSTGHCSLFTSICISEFFVHVPPIYAVCSGQSKAKTWCHSEGSLPPSVQKHRTTCLQIRPCTWNWTWNLELLQVILLNRYVWEASPNSSLVIGSKIFCTTFCSFMDAFDLTKASVALNQHEVYSNNSLML